MLRDGFDAFAAGIAVLSDEADKAPLRVSTTTAFAGHWLLPRLSSWNEQHPAVNLEVIATEQVVDLRGGEVDMAIRYAKQPPNDLESVTLFEDRYIPVCSPRLLENLSEDDWVGVIKQLRLLHFRWRQEDDPDAPSWTLWRDRARLVDRRVDKLESQRGMTFSEEHMAIDAAIAGQGAALASSILVERDLQTGVLKCISNVSLPGRMFYAVNVRNSPREHLIDRFVEWAIGTRPRGTPRVPQS